MNIFTQWQKDHWRNGWDGSILGPEHRKRTKTERAAMYLEMSLYRTNPVHNKNNNNTKYIKSPTEIRFRLRHRNWPNIQFRLRPKCSGTNSVSAETLPRNCKIGVNCNTRSLEVRLLAVGG